MNKNLFGGFLAWNLFSILARKLNFIWFIIPPTNNMFNLEKDPSEKYNVADQHPGVLEELREVAEKHKEKREIKPSVVK